MYIILKGQSFICLFCARNRSLIRQVLVLLSYISSQKDKVMEKGANQGSPSSCEEQRVGVGRKASPRGAC